MPELPEIQTITNQLKKHVVGATIKSVELSKEFKVSKDLKTTLKGKVIAGVERVAKNIVFILDSKGNLLFHLAMTGQILFRKKGFKKDKWQRIKLILKKDGKTGELRYCDMRMFGKVKILTQKELDKLRNQYGPDPFDKSLSPEKLLKILKKKKTNIKNALLDQKLISGIGNIYVNDALWLAKIHPESKTNDLGLAETQRLLTSIREVLNESLSNRGSTLKDKMYVDIFGKFGNHQNFLKIYGATKCSRCNIQTKFKKINGRGTYFCNKCQEISGQVKLL